MPYNPGIVYTGAESLRSSSQSNVQSAMGIAQWIAGMSKEAKAAKASQTLLETLPPDTLKKMGIVDPANIKNLTREQVTGKLQSLAVESHLAETAEAKARADALAQALKQHQDTQAQDQAFNTEFLKDNRTRQGATAAGRSVAPVFQALGQVMPGMAEAGEAAQNVQAPEPGIMDILRMAAQSGVPPERSAAMAENVARAMHAMSESRPGQKPPKTLQFVKSPTGADVALSPETGAFQYDPFSKAEAEAGRSKFTVQPLLDRYEGKVVGYGVHAQFGTEAEAKRYADEQNKTVGGGDKTAAAGKGKPTRSIAADFVKKFGKDKAKEELQKAGYDPSGYAD